ncbi:MAG TPA: hypothetical protein EYP98_01270 [Planctomycetes bacterium]|nr:hypothetical protein [Planctomycetota bacterium]
MKAALLILLLPIVAALAFVPAKQDPQKPKDAAAATEVVTVLSISELHYVTLQGKTMKVPARNVVEIRMFDGQNDHIRLELLYDNGEYSLIDAQAMHLLRSGGGKRDVRLIRTTGTSMRFPQLP